MDREQHEWESLRAQKRQGAWKNKVKHWEPQRRRERKLTDGGGKEENAERAPRRKKLKYEKASEIWGEATAPREQENTNLEGE